MLVGNNAMLVGQLQALPLLDNRYSKIVLVNMPAGVKRGHFSLVFKAFDEVEQKYVALKFYDLDPAKHDYYRLQCFDREHSLLALLRGAHRCLQLASPLSAYDLQVPVAGGQPPTVSLPAKYFAVDWLEDEIDEYFLDQSQFSAVDKLILFTDAILAVESLHSRGIFHRDLKADNLRSDGKGQDRVVVAIDLGTAARLESGGLATAYYNPVGMLLYASPEAFCGFAGCREVAALSDIYSLGCMLFELFNAEDFYSAMRRTNSDFEARLSALQSRIDPSLSDAEKMAAWVREAHHVLRGLSPVDISGAGTSVPPAVAQMLQSVLNDMTSADFRGRSHRLDFVRARIRSAVRCLQNEAFAKKKAKDAQRMRFLRKEAARKKAERIAERFQVKQLEVKNGAH